MQFLKSRPVASGIALAGAAFVIATSAAGSAAHAQSAFDRSRNVGVLQRPHPEFDAMGLRLGQFLAFPKLEVGVSHNDNVYAAETQEIGDTIYSTSPSISIQSQWPRHALSLNAGLDDTRYADLKTENNTTYYAGAAGRVDVRSDMSVSGTANHTTGIEPRGSSSYIIPSKSPIEYKDDAFSVKAVKEFNRLRVTGSAAFDKLDYEDAETFGGANIDQDFRDRDASTQTVRVDYAISPMTAVFAEVAGSQLKYDSNPTRNSDGLRGLAGVNFELTDLITGEASIGYLTRSFDDGVTGDLNQFAYRGNLSWFVTPLMTLSANAAKEVRDSAVLGTPAYVADAFGATADYEALRNLIVSGNVSYSRDVYQDIDREDRRWGVGVSATYLMNRNVGIKVSLDQFTQDSSGAFRTVDYTYRTAGVALVLQY